ncbi:MAG: hypothetical protein H7Z13_03920 [Ferruginibacter sp.]|nr:hypothetical protein [Ferruginibacter sp.]
MKSEIISHLHNNFELAVNQSDDDECWFGGDLPELLGKAKLKNFEKIIETAKMAYRNAK